MGPKLAGFVYDGLGRLIKTYRADRQANDEEERHYYDGVRRVLEVVNETPVGSDARREYVWGPGYVDAVVCQIAAGGPQAGLYYYLQDANYNVLAVLDSAGTPVLQYVHSPYGRTLVRETAGTFPVNRIAHQGLFFERICVNPMETIADAALTPGGVGLYYNRNRWYSPELGRFMTRDPNATARPPVAAIDTNGDASVLALSAFDPNAHYADGANLYGYLRSNPQRYVDPAGGVTMEIATLVGFTLGYGVGQWSLNGKYGLGTFILAGWTLRDVSKGGLLPGYLKPGPAMGKGLGKWGKKEATRLLDWAADRPWAQRLVRGVSSETVGLFSGGLGHAVAFEFGILIGAHAAVLDQIEFELGY